MNALRAFEAAARLGGFTAAAAELLVTPGAVAQQVRALEAWAGAQLFARHAQGVRLTPLGREAAKAYGAAFDVLGAAPTAFAQGRHPTPSTSLRCQGWRNCGYRLACQRSALRPALFCRSAPLKRRPI